MNIALEIVGVKSRAAVQAVLEAAPGYYRRVGGTSVPANAAEREMTDMPPPEKCSPTTEKFFCLLREDAQPVGVVDMLKDYPEAGIAYIGLFLLAETRQGQGVGRAAYARAEDFIASRLKASRIRLGVAETNDVEGFWSKMGYRRNGRTYIFEVENTGGIPVFEMEKALG